MTGIGGSDAAAVMGCHPYKSAYALYCEKVGLVEPDDLTDNEYVEWGNRLEPLVADKYSEVTGEALEKLPPFTVLRHPSVPCIVGTPDRLILAEDGSWSGVLEVKTAGEFVQREWDDGPPLHYQVQLQTYLAITGLRHGAFALLVGGNKFRAVDVERNDDFIAELEVACADFWTRVLERNPPPVDGSDSTAKAIKKLYPRDSGECMTLPEDMAPMVVERNKLKDEKAVLEHRLDEIDTILKGTIGAASMADVPGLGSFTFTTSDRAVYTVAPTTVRTLRWKPIGGAKKRKR